MNNLPNGRSSEQIMFTIILCQLFKVEVTPIFHIFFWNTETKEKFPIYSMSPALAYY